mmetsp:Transcript_29334/g.63661  ORF Transcript_29334/g.63661 Transcript_29334/m.63661 type:complete len:326 (+) Transcript_29334:218-1195(+)
MHSVIADIIRGLDCAFCISFITSGFFIISCAFPKASPIPPMPPMPPGIPPEKGLAPPKGVEPPFPPNGFAPGGVEPPPPAGPPIPIFLSMSAMPPISIPPIPPIPPPPNGLPAPPPKGLPPPPCCCPPPADFFLGPAESSVNTSTSAALYSAYPSLSTDPAPPAAEVFLTPSTRASAKAFTNSLFSKKLLVETPRLCNSALSSLAFIALHFNISSASRSSRLAVLVAVSSVDSFRTFFFFFLPAVLVSVDEAEVPLVEAVLALVLLLLAIGVLPSARAFSRASTSSLFSKKLFVEIPYDSNSFLISPALIDDISGRSDVAEEKSP